MQTRRQCFSWECCSPPGAASGVLPAKGGIPAWDERAGDLLAAPWVRTSLWPHKSPSRRARLGQGTPQAVEGNTDTTAVQGFETSPGKAAGREHHWTGQGEVQGPELLVIAASVGTLVGL